MRICLVSETWHRHQRRRPHARPPRRRAARPRHRTQRYDLGHRSPLGPAGTGHADELQVRGVSPADTGKSVSVACATAWLQRLWQKQRPDVVYLATQGPLGWSAPSHCPPPGIPVTPAGTPIPITTATTMYCPGWRRPCCGRYAVFTNGCAPLWFPPTPRRT
ncbi:hypothetical protein DSL92_03160 [Billgrantia gudaonensis]|uniref:Uncharacterized protein n=1 Tax=Billgrantia gudaonensis TaxID=376427 RepID=A0A432JKM6_9GAMM|nr:hypothetical protein DSL92_03160 [Halomonas gudaonensis]